MESLIEILLKVLIDTVGVLILQWLIKKIKEWWISKKSQPILTYIF